MDYSWSKDCSLPMDLPDKLNYQIVLSLILIPSYSSIITIIIKAFSTAFRFTTFTFAAIIIMSFSSLIGRGRLMA